jgi:hypothetical protein
MPDAASISGGTDGRVPLPLSTPRHRRDGGRINAPSPFWCKPAGTGSAKRSGQERDARLYVPLGAASPRSRRQPAPIEPALHNLSIFDRHAIGTTPQHVLEEYRP